MNGIFVTSEDLFNIQQAAKKLGVARMTVYRWIETGKIISIKLGGMPFIPKSEIDRILRTAEAAEDDKVVAHIEAGDVSNAK